MTTTKSDSLQSLSLKKASLEDILLFKSDRVVLPPRCSTIHPLFCPDVQCNNVSFSMISNPNMFLQRNSGSATWPNELCDKDVSYLDTV